ncbi:MAG: hypothetical protein ACYCW6_16645 [Candidatus Xenobia bacterium]
MPIIYIISFLTSLAFAAVVFFGFVVLPTCIAGACLAGAVSTFSGPHQPFYFDDVDRARGPRLGTAPIPAERALVEQPEQPVSQEVENPHPAD